MKNPFRDKTAEEVLEKINNLKSQVEEQRARNSDSDRLRNLRAKLGDECKRYNELG